MGMSRTQWKLLTAASIAAALVLCGAFFLPALTRPSNCGGNSAALSACKSVAVCIRLIAAERGDGPVSIGGLRAAEREHFKQVAGLNWLGGARILVTPEIRGGQPSGKEIIAVCDRAFDNVPRRRLGKAPLTHAVAYADGSTALMSIDEFQRVDLSRFVDVRAIQNSKVAPSGSANASPPIGAETNRAQEAHGSRRSPD